jgi:hypothetical protein
MTTKETVSDYVERQPMPQREICSALRTLILRTYPDIEERMRLGVPYYGDEFYILSLKDHVNLGMSIEGLDERVIASLKGSGKTMRCVELRHIEDVDEAKLIRLMEQVHRTGSADPVRD